MERPLGKDHEIDIALDPFPFNGHTTMCDAVWLGVPVVMLLGQMYASRFGSSVLANVGLEKFVEEGVPFIEQMGVPVIVNVVQAVAGRVGSKNNPIWWTPWRCWLIQFREATLNPLCGGHARARIVWPKNWHNKIIPSGLARLPSCCTNRDIACRPIVKRAKENSIPIATLSLSTLPNRFSSFKSDESRPFR